MTNLAKILLILTFIMIFVLAYNILFYKPLKASVEIEIGESVPPVEKFLKDENNKANFETNINQINTDTVGEHNIEIKVSFFNKKTVLKIVDSTPPKGEGVNHEIWYDEFLEINNFVTNIQDQTDVRLEYIKSPNFSVIGKQEVVVKLIDEGKNHTSIESELIIKADTEPPTFSGIKDQSVFTDEPISYRRGIKVIDNKDQNLDFEVDNSNVDITKSGTYEVFYTCEDDAGNQTIEKSSITVKEKPVFLLSKEALNARGDKILNQITTEQMSKLQVLDAIFWYTRWNIKYTGQSDKTSWEIGASKALEEMEGDCFNYYALAHLLLDRAGFEYKPIKRIEASKSRHYWLLVKHGNFWYHYDPTWSPTGYDFEGFMISESEAKAFTERVSTIRENYYVYDKSLYENIKIAEEPLIKD